MRKILFNVGSAIVVSFLVSACSESALLPQRSATSSTSQSLEEYTEFPNPNINENEKRYHATEGISEYTPIAESKKTVRDEAKAYCHKSGRKMIVTAEDIIKPPMMINHNPHITITFVCQDLNPKKLPTPKKVEAIKMTNNKYNDLFTIKKLLDKGILTQKEFEEEKRKILNRD